MKTLPSETSIREFLAAVASAEEAHGAVSGPVWWAAVIGIVVSRAGSASVSSRQCCGVQTRGGVSQERPPFSAREAAMRAR